MKNILNDYKEQIKNFLSDRRYTITVIITLILSYGFAITHYSIGIDDLCFDRYVTRNIHIISKKMGHMGLI